MTTTMFNSNSNHPFVSMLSHVRAKSRERVSHSYDSRTNDVSDWSRTGAQLGKRRGATEAGDDTCRRRGRATAPRALLVTAAASMPARSIEWTVREDRSEAPRATIERRHAITRVAREALANPFTPVVVPRIESTAACVHGDCRTRRDDVVASEVTAGNANGWPRTRHDLHRARAELGGEPGVAHRLLVEREVGGEVVEVRVRDRSVRFRCRRSTELGGASENDRLIEHLSHLRHALAEIREHRTLGRPSFLRTTKRIDARGDEVRAVRVTYRAPRSRAVAARVRAVARMIFDGSAA